MSRSMINRSSATSGHAAMCLVSLLFGGLNVLLQWAFTLDIGEFDVRVSRSAVFTLYRDVGATVLLVTASFASGQLRRMLPLLRSHSYAIVQAGVCGIGGGIFFTVGLALTNAACAGLLQPAVPVLTVGLGLALGLERRSVGKALAVSLTVAGALVAVDVSALNLSSALGWMALLLNALCLAGWLLQQRRLLDQGLDPLTLTSAMYGAGTAFVFLACVACFALSPRLLSLPGALSLSGKEAAALAYATVCSSALSYALITWASARLDPSIISLWASGQSIFTILLSRLAFGTLPSALQLAGGLLITLGLCVCVAVTLLEERANGLLTDAQRSRPSDAVVNELHAGEEQHHSHRGRSLSPAPSPPYVSFES